MTEFDVLDACCVAGVRVPNEDALGWSGPFAWVLDGATPLSPRGIRAADWARALSTSLAALAPGAGSPAGLVRMALPRAASDCGWTGPDGLLPHELVSAAGILAMARPGGVDLLAWGDCEAVLLYGNGSTGRFLDPRLPAIDAANLESYAELRAGGIPDDETQRRWFREHVDPARALMNTEGGYPTLSPDGRGLDMGLAGSFEGAVGVLLMSDGLAWALDGFGLVSEAGVMAGERPLASVVEGLRAAEAEDGDLRRVIRFKVSDDATGLRLAVR